MQNLYSLNSCLYRVEGDAEAFIQGQDYEVKIEVYDTTAKVNEISAYTFHPNKTTWWNVIINWFIELLYGRTAVLVRVEGEPHALYVRVDDLSRVLNISSRVIQAAAKEEELTDFLVEHQMKQTAQKIKALAREGGGFWTHVEQKSIKELIKELGYQNVFKVVDNDKFDSEWMASTLIEIGKQLSSPSLDYSESHHVYDFKVSLPNIFIWKIEGFKKTTINLVDLSVKVEDLMKETAEKVKKIVQKEGDSWTHIEQNGIEKLIKQIGYQNVLDALNCDQFESEWMARTLVNLGKTLTGYSSSDPKHKNSYEFITTLPHIYIWKIKNYKKTKLDLSDLTITTENLPRPLIPLPSILPSKVPPTVQRPIKQPSSSLLDRVTQIFKPSISKEEQEFEVISTVLGVNPKDMKHLEALAARVGYSNLIVALGRLQKDAKKIMINTYIEIGKELIAPAFLDGIFSNFRLQYVGKKKEGKKQLTYAFAINKLDIFIAQDKLGEGSFKVISDAIKINNLDDLFVRIKVKDQEEKDTPIDLKETRAAINEIKKEAKFIEALHKNPKEKGCDCIVLPFACEISSKGKKKKIIFFQKKYDGDGDKLKKAPLFQQVNVLRDVSAGLAFMHKLGFVHMDMKPANFLIEGDIDGKVSAKGKVSDFGMTVENGSHLPGGSLLYLAPEALKIYLGRPCFNPFCRVNAKIDSFAFGITILEILDDTPNKLFGLMDQRQIDNEIQQCAKKVRFSSSKKETQIKLAMIEVASQLLKHNPSQRSNCAQATAQLEKIAQACT